MATWTYDGWWRKDGIKVSQKEAIEALNAGEAAIAEVETLKKAVKSKEEELEGLYQSVLAAANVKDEGDIRFGWKPALELIANKLVKAERLRTVAEGWHKSLSESQGEAESLRAEVAALKAAVERLRGYANQLRDTQRHKGIGDAIVGILDEYAPTPLKVEWEARKFGSGNTVWWLNDSAQIWHVLISDRSYWTTADGQDFADLAEAKAAVESKLKGQ